MTVISTEKNADDLTLVFVTEFDAPPARLWQVWEDPRQLERWWGPPGWPATFVRHDLAVDGQSRYYMSGPDGEKGHGYWHVTAVDAPNRIEFDNGLAGDDGEPMPGMSPGRAIVTIEPNGAGTRMTVTNQFLDTAQMEMMIGMGMAEGMGMALGQLDAILA